MQRDYFLNFFLSYMLYNIYSSLILYNIEYSTKYQKYRGIYTRTLINLSKEAEATVCSTRRIEIVATGFLIRTVSDHSEERLGWVVLMPHWTPHWSGDVARFEASLKAATHVAISILVVFSFTSTRCRSGHQGLNQRLSFVTVADLQPRLSSVLTAIGTNG